MSLLESSIFLFVSLMKLVLILFAAILVVGTPTLFAIATIKSGSKFIKEALRSIKSLI